MHALLLLPSLFFSGNVNSTVMQPPVEKKIKEITFHQFIQNMLETGADYSFDAGRSGFLEVPSGAPSKTAESDENSDNFTRSSYLVLNPSAEKPEPLCVVFHAGKEDLPNREEAGYYFRLTPGGVLEKAFKSQIKLDEKGEAVLGSGVVTPKDISSVEIKERFKHELNFWLKGMYRLSPEEIAARKAAASGAAAKPPESVAVLNSDVDEPSYQTPENPENYAVVVGIEKYSDLPEARFAERDAQAVRAHLVALGYPQRNIHLLLGEKATKTGIIKNVETWLANNVGKDSTVFFYYSGHGAPETKSRQPYLVPFDGDPQYMGDTGYPLQRLYAKLGALKAKRVIIALDSCFSGTGGRSVLAKGTKPLILQMDTAPVGPKAVVLSASRFDQISGTMEMQAHGTFTYFLLKGLNGGAVDRDGGITTQSLYDYLEPKVEDAARRENRDQAPQMIPPNAADVKLR